MNYKALFHHESRRETRRLLVAHFAILCGEFVQQFTHETRVLLCPRLVKPVPPRFQIEKHFGGLADQILPTPLILRYQVFHVRKQGEGFGPPVMKRSISFRTYSQNMNILDEEAG